MKIEIIRHGKVDLEWKKWSTSAQFDRDCREYDVAPVVSVPKQIKNNIPKKIYVSGLPRTKQTAELLFGKREAIVSPLLNEVPLRSCMDTNLKLPLWFWHLAGRTQWFFSSSRQQEKKAKTALRAKKFVEGMLREKEDCIIVTHGFYMHTLIKVLKSKGFTVSRTRINYHNLQRITAEKTEER